MRHCLIISPHFPPSTVAGVHRARHLANHLPAHGWDPTIICVDPSHHVEALDPGLAALVRADARVIRTGAIPVGWTRPFGLVGEIGLRGFWHLRAGISRCIADRRPDVIMITGSPFYPLLLSGWIRRRWGIPVLIDLQDPWVSRDGASRRQWTKGWLAHRLACLLEPAAVRGASWITSVSDRQNQEMAERYPDLDAARMTAIPIGGDPADFASIGNESLRKSGTGEFLFSYVGTALPRSNPVLELLFRGLRLLSDTRPQIAERLRFRFIGTSNQPGIGGSPRVLPFAEAAGVAHMVTEQPGRIPFLEALRTLVTSDATLMIGSDEPHYTASKIYPCLMAGRPYLSLFHSESSAHRILKEAGGGMSLSFADPADLTEMVHTVAAGLTAIVERPESLGAIDPAAYADFTADAVSGEFAHLFDRLALEAAS